MSTQQRLRQTSWRAIHGGPGLTYNGDAMLAMQMELAAALLPVPDTYNGRLVAWLQLRLSSTEPNLAGLMQAFAEVNGAQNWSSLGSFPPRLSSWASR